MDDQILSLSDRGQLTIPKQIRKQLLVKHFVCNVKNREIILSPL